MKYNLKKQRALHNSNFTICHNEILFTKINDKPISLEAIGLFLRLLSLPPDWDLNYAGLSVICGCCKDKIERLLTELKQAGYLTMIAERVKGKIKGHNYYLNETINMNLWNEENKPEMVNSENQYLENELISESQPDPEKPDLEKPDPEKPDLVFEQQYNIKYNKENKDKKLNTIKDEISKDESFDSGKQKNDTLKIKKKDLTVLDENNTNIINLMNAKSSENESLSPKEQRKLERQKKRDKQLQEKISQEQNKEKQSVSTMADKKVGDLTQLENYEARIQQKVNLVTEQTKYIEQRSRKKEHIKTTIFRKIDSEINNQELALCLKDFVSMWIQIGRPMTIETYNKQIQTLNSLSKDINEQIKIVNKSIEKGWTGFYALHNYKQPVSTFKPSEKQKQVYEQKIKQEYSEDAFEIATDENGKALIF